MEASVPALVAISASICGVKAPDTVIAKQVCNSSKVSDHHAVVPTVSSKDAGISALPAGKRSVLQLVARQLLCAVSEAHSYDRNDHFCRMWRQQLLRKGKGRPRPRLETVHSV
jgi:DNA topoisomerase-3